MRLTLTYLLILAWTVCCEALNVMVKTAHEPDNYLKYMEKVKAMLLNSTAR